MPDSLSPRRVPWDFASLPASSPRAIEIFDWVPPGCKLKFVENNAHSPHLRAGEVAVVDMNDREFVSGEVYLVQWSAGTPHASQSIRWVKARKYFSDWQHKVEALGIYFMPLCTPKFGADGKLDWNQPVFLSDGPLDPKYLPQYLLGRVIGIYQAPQEAARTLPPPRRQLGAGEAQ
jgi:hypothetical protein